MNSVGRKQWRGVASMVAILMFAPVLAARASAEEADNFTCRAVLKRDSLAALDGWINARIAEALADANSRGPGSSCDGKCLFAELRGRVGASYPHPLTMIPHSRLSGWINKQPDLDRCRLEFSQTIYGAKSYNHAWMFPFNGRIIYMADSIRLAGRTVGVDKLDHFIREGLDHWRFIAEGSGDIAASVAREMGPAKKQFSWTEYGLKGLSLTGVVAYADIAAGYFGYRFWDEILSMERPESFVAFDATTKRYSQRRPFTFADYVNDAWDEGLNPSMFDPKLEVEVAAALKARSIASPTTTCRPLAKLPQAALYVNPVCLAPQPIAINSKATWQTRLNLDSTPSATSRSIVTAGPALKPRRSATSSPKPSSPIHSASTRSASANIIGRTLPSPRPKSSSAPSPAARNS